MKYKIIEIEYPNGDKQEHVIIEREDGTFESFPVDENNPRYLQWALDGDELDMVES